MHELSIAESVVRIVCRHAGERTVARVELRIGHLRQVVPSALAFSFELVSEGTVAEGAELIIEHVPAAGRCRRCGAESELSSLPLQCGSCGGWDLDLLRGEELLVDSLELEDDALIANGGRGSGH